MSFDNIVSPSDDSSEAGEGSDVDDGDGITLWEGESSDDATLQVEDAEEGHSDTELQNEVNEGSGAVSTSDVSEYVTPVESPVNLSSDSSSDEASEGARPVCSARRSRRMRRGRNFLTYDQLGEPKISRYTMMATEHRP